MKKNLNLFLQDALGDILYSIPTTQVIKRDLGKNFNINVYAPVSRQTGSDEILKQYEGKLFDKLYYENPGIARASKDGNIVQDQFGDLWGTNYMDDSYRESLEKQGLHHHQIFAKCLIGRILTPEEEKFNFEIPVMSNIWAKNLTQNKKYVVFEYGSPYPTKNISSELKNNILMYLCEFAEIDNIYIIGKNFSPHNLYQHNKIKYIQGEKVYNVAALIKNAKFFIGLETGIMSIAGWIGTPTIYFRQYLIGEHLTEPVNSRFICFKREPDKHLQDIKFHEVKLGIWEFLKINRLI